MSSEVDAAVEAISSAAPSAARAAARCAALRFERRDLRSCALLSSAGSLWTKILQPCGSAIGGGATPDASKSCCRRCCCASRSASCCCLRCVRRLLTACHSSASAVSCWSGDAPGAATSSRPTEAGEAPGPTNASAPDRPPTAAIETALTWASMPQRRRAMAGADAVSNEPGRGRATTLKLVRSSSACVGIAGLMLPGRCPQEQA
mmetsp:Transcript_83316/g.240763  ORF Transcript_83316/g.240763 Transcript_83316/m.240763 type:complete len:205 (+) Transcript_83316:1351-1965(+)